MVRFPACFPLVFIAIGCRGGAPPRSADETTAANTASTSGQDTPLPRATPASSSNAQPALDAASPAPQGPALKLAALRLTMPHGESKEVGFEVIEVKGDGSVLSDGKPVMKFVGDELQEYDHGMTMFAVARDGSVTGATGNAVGRFTSSDELVLSHGGKLVVSDDGLIRLTVDKGKTTVLRPKFDSAPVWARREAVLIGLSFVAYSALGQALSRPDTKLPTK
jgi:hypothetical protein